MARFAFRFSRWYRLLAAPFGVTPSTTMVEVDGEHLTARFGPWVVQTPVANIAGVEETGPFTLPKTAGPAHLSLADMGLTMATNADRGVCLRFKQPVAGMDPFGWIRHPGLTVTVDGVEHLRRVIEDVIEHGRPPPDTDSAVMGTPASSPWQLVGRWVRWPAGMALAAARYLASARKVRRSSETRSAPPPEPMDVANPAGLQPIDRGVGPAYERVYGVTIVGSDLTPQQLLDRVTSHLNTVSPTEVAEFVPAGPPDGGAEGQHYRIRMPGPWHPRVRVIERSPTSLRFATLKGHMEAGEIEFSARPAEPDGHLDGRSPLVFQIKSVARSGDRGFQLLYRVLAVGKRMQEHMWAHMCGRVVLLAGGQADGPITVHTIRYER